MLPDAADWSEPAVAALLGVTSLDRFSSETAQGKAGMNNAVSDAAKISLVARDCAVQQRAAKGGTLLRIFHPDEVENLGLPEPEASPLLQ